MDIFVFAQSVGGVSAFEKYPLVCAALLAALFSSACGDMSGGGGGGGSVPAALCGNWRGQIQGTEFRAQLSCDGGSRVDNLSVPCGGPVLILGSTDSSVDTEVQLDTGASLCVEGLRNRFVGIDSNTIEARFFAPGEEPGAAQPIFSGTMARE